MGIGNSIFHTRGNGAAVALADTEAVIVMLCDQPRVDAALIQEMLAAYRRTNAPLVACRYNGTHGVPALFDRKLYPALLQLVGAKGAKSIIQAHAGELVAIDAPQAAYDVDTLADYRNCTRRKTHRFDDVPEHLGSLD